MDQTLALEPRFYCYLHRKRSNGVIFYAGKGTSRGASKRVKKLFARAFNARDRSVFWKRAVAKAGGFDVEIVGRFQTESEAFAKERELISFYGRRDSGGILVNLTDGGDGVCGWRPSETTRANIRAALNRPEVRAKLVASASRPQNVKHCREMARWPEVRAKLLPYRQSPESKKRAAQLSHMPQVKLARSRHMLGRLADPEYKAKVVARLQSPEAWVKNRAAQRTPESLQKRREAAERAWKDPNKRSTRRVINTDTGEVFHCIRAAELRLGCTAGTLYAQLVSRTCKPKTPYRLMEELPGAAKQWTDPGYPVEDSLTGEVFPSVNRAAQARGLVTKTLRAWLLGEYPNPTTLRFVEDPKVAKSEPAPHITFVSPVEQQSSDTAPGLPATAQPVAVQCSETQ